MSGEIRDEILKKQTTPSSAPLKKNSVLVICGPTAGGKSDLAMKLAEILGGEIISCDSMQIYRGMDIGTAKPSAEDRKNVPHHLIDIKNPGERYSVADYCRDADAAITEVMSRGKLPIVAGGTPLYLTALIRSYVFEEKRNPELRKILNERLSTEGSETLRNELHSLDPECAENIDVNNHKRIIRALELTLTDGLTRKERIQKQRASVKDFDFRSFCLSHPRKLLYERINQRVDGMISEGLIDECRKILSLGLPESSTCMQAIGYKEIFPFIRGECTEEEAREKLKTATRNFAKRQLTWFRRMDELIWIFPDEKNDAISQISEDLQLL